MVKKICLGLSTLFMLSLMLNIVLVVAAESKPDYVMEKEETEKERKESRPEEAVKEEKEDKERVAEYLRKLEEKVNALEEKYKSLPSESPEAKEYLEKIKEIEAQMKKIKAKHMLPPEARIMERHRRMMKQKVEEKREQMERLHELHKKLKDTMAHLRELRKHHPDSPKIEEFSERIAKLKKKINDLKRKRPLRPEFRRPPRPPFEKGELRIFRIEHLPAEYVAEIISEFISPNGVMVFEKHTNSVIVRDNPEFLRDVEKIIKNIDVPEGRPIRERARAEAEERHRRMVSEGVLIVAKTGETVETKIFKKMDRPVTLSIKLEKRKEEEVKFFVEAGRWETTIEGKLNERSSVEFGPFGLSLTPRLTEDGKVKVVFRIEKLLLEQ